MESVSSVEEVIFRFYLLQEELGLLQFSLPSRLSLKGAYARQRKAVELYNPCRAMKAAVQRPKRVARISKQTPRAPIIDRSELQASAKQLSLALRKKKAPGALIHSMRLISILLRHASSRQLLYFSLRIVNIARRGGLRNDPQVAALQRAQAAPPRKRLQAPQSCTLPNLPRFQELSLTELQAMSRIMAKLPERYMRGVRRIVAAEAEFDSDADIDIEGLHPTTARRLQRFLFLAEADEQTRRRLKREPTSSSHCSSSSTE